MDKPQKKVIEDICVCDCIPCKLGDGCKQCNLEEASKGDWANGALCHEGDNSDYVTPWNECCDAWEEYIKNPPLDKIKQLIISGWRVEIDQIEGQVSAYASRGDFNCPHRKEYDPADGHGFSQIWAGDIEGQLERCEALKTVDEAIDMLFDKCNKVIPGQAWETK
jgi:hypothetical protein